MPKTTTNKPTKPKTATIALPSVVGVRSGLAELQDNEIEITFATSAPTLPPSSGAFIWRQGPGLKVLVAGVKADKIAELDAIKAHKSLKSR
jgi:hypothetical protein